MKDNFTYISNILDHHLSRQLFIENYYEFKLEKTPKELIASLADNYSTTYNIIIDSARDIFSNKLNLLALNCCIHSNISDELITKAKEIYAKDKEVFIQNIKSLDDVYTYIENYDYAGRVEYVTSDLVKIRNKFSDSIYIEKIQYEINSLELMVSNNAKIDDVWVQKNEDGTESRSPDYKSFPEEHLIYLIERMNNCKHVLFKAKYALILWRLAKGIQNVKIAIDSYLEIVENLLILEKTDKFKDYGARITENLQIAFYLCLETGKTKYKFDELKEKILYLLNEFQFKQENISIVKHRLITLIVEKYKFFDCELFNDLANYCWSLSKSSPSSFVTIDYLELGRKIDKIIKQKTYNWDLAEAEFYESQIIEKDFVSVDYCLKARNLYSKLKHKDKVKELEEKCASLSKEIKLSSFPIDIPVENIKNIIRIEKDLVKKATNPYSIVKYLIDGKGVLPNIQDVQNSEKSQCLMALGNITQFDDKGHISKKANTEDEVEDIEYWMSYDIFMIYSTISICEFIKESIIEGKLNSELLINYLIHKSWLGSGINKTLFNGKQISYCWLKNLQIPLIMFFDEFQFFLQNPKTYTPNFSAFIDIISTKFEGIIRDILELKNVTIFKVKSNQTTEEHNINNYLRSSELTQFLSEDTIHYLRWLLIENKNLRNKVAHSLMQPDDYSLENACLLLVGFLRLCNIEFLIDNECVETNN